MKNILEVIICRLSDMEEHISNLEDRIVEITQSKDKKKKRIKKNEDSLRDLWDHQVYYHLHYRGTKRSEKEKGRKHIW